MTLKPDLSCLVDPALRRRVDAALAAMPPKPNGTPANPIRRALLDGEGHPVPGMGAFFRATRHNKPGTEVVYASVVRMWVASCLAVGADPLYMDRDALEEYRDEVRLDEDGISEATWNSGLPALRAFHDAAVSEGLIQEPLLERSDWRRLALVDRSVRRPRIVTSAEYHVFRNVGLNALTLDGAMSRESYALRTPVRDTLYADFLLAHGTRRAEAGHLTLLDLPLRIPNRSFNISELPPEICKWGSGRPLEEQASWARRLASYHDTEWHVTVETAQPALRRMQRSNHLAVVTEVDSRFSNCRLRIKGLGWRRLSNLKKQERRVLVCTADVAREIGNEPGMGAGLTAVSDGWLVPLAIFPGTRSPMLSPEAWSSTFREANNRVDAAKRLSGQSGVRRVTPHMLRHTFATNTLADELQQVSEADREYLAALNDARATDLPMLRRRYANPLLRVKDLLGHRSLDTTLLYLHLITQESRAAIPVGDSWVERFLDGPS